MEKRAPFPRKPQAGEGDKDTRHLESKNPILYSGLDSCHGSWALIPYAGPRFSKFLLGGTSAPALLFPAACALLEGTGH